MADYWKSQPKKYCDFCKCWIADNKPSVEFHEKGKRHKENVEKRLKEIGQQSRKDHRESLKVDGEMKKMEDAAMKAYLKDIEGDGDCDYTSRCIRQEKEERLLAEERRKQEVLEEERRSREERSKLVECSGEGGSGNGEETAEAAKEEKPSPWHEAKSDEGHTYYWHVESGESVWEAPTEGFVSVSEQEAAARTRQDAEERAKREKEHLEAKRKEEEEREKRAEETARRAREKMRARAAKKEEREIVPFEPVVEGPAPRPDPYGAWRTVETLVQEPVDLELPRQDYVETFVPVVTETEKKFKFKEKTVRSLDAEGSSDFKKRKLNTGSRRNMRQRLDQD